MTDDAPDAEGVLHLALAESATWEDVGRTAVGGELFEARHDVDAAFHDLEETLRAGEAIDERQVRDARMALNEARRILEEHVATVADGTTAWGQPIPNMPYSVYRQVVET